jgi:hypothetical protein
VLLQLSLQEKITRHTIVEICLKGTERADVHEIHLPQVRSQWLVLVNTVMKIRVL